MAVKMKNEIAIHHHPITLPDGLGIARKIVGEEKEKNGRRPCLSSYGANLPLVVNNYC